MGEVAFGEEFVAGLGADFFGADKFEANTYIHFFDAEGGALLQSLSYHTSCSQPINIGDETGYAKLVGYVGELGAAETVSEYGEDADEGPGPEAQFGSEVTFTYVVTNAGTKPLANVDLSDSVLGTPTYVEGDTDMNGLLDLNETWIYTATDTALSGQVTNTGTVTGTAVFEVDGQQISFEVSDADDANYIVVGGPSIEIEKYVKVENWTAFVPYVCETYGKPTALSFDYEESTEISNLQDGKATIVAGTTLDDDDVSWVLVTDKSNPFDSKAKIFFSDVVAVGDEFTAYSADGGESTFKADTYVHFFDDNPFDNLGSNELLQSVKYHTSCSQPINVGDVIGDATLVGYVGELGEVEVSQYGEDADEGPGPEAAFGSTVDFTFLISNTGTEDLTEVVFVDDRISDPASQNFQYVGGDDGDGVLNVGETWVYTASEEAPSEFGDVVNTASVTALAEVSGYDPIAVGDMDQAHYTAVEDYDLPYDSFALPELVDALPDVEITLTGAVDDGWTV